MNEIDLINNYKEGMWSDLNFLSERSIDGALCIMRNEVVTNILDHKYLSPNDLNLLRKASENLKPLVFSRDTLDLVNLMGMQVRERSKGFLTLERVFIRLSEERQIRKQFKLEDSTVLVARNIKIDVCDEILDKCDVFGICRAKGDFVGSLIILGKLTN